MPRQLVLGNGTLLASFDEHLQMRDLYFPYVGMEDHTTFGTVHRLGAFVEGKGFSWVSDGTWTVSLGYKLETLVGNCVLKNDRLGIEMTVEDCVHPVHDILLRRFSIKSTDGQEKTVRLFFHHDFHIYGDNQKDTAFYEPYTNSVIHYRQSRYFLIGGQTDNPQECFVGHSGSEYDSVLHSMKRIGSCGISSFSVGKANYRGLLGTWKDAEDGILEKNTIEQGSVDSTVAIHSIVKPDKATDVIMWLCLGKTLDDVVALQQTVLEETPERLTRNTVNYWKSWVNKEHVDFGSLPSDIVDLFKRSLMMVRLHADNHGGIVAAADSDIMAFNRDTYTYVWPRDGAFVSLALDAAGYSEVSRRFFEFCAKVQEPDGYLLHKYNPDGSVGSSWHPWFRDNEPQLPIQEDETALVIYALDKHFQRTQDFEFLQEIFEKFIKKAAQFLCDFREEETGLPLPSYDLWEEHRGIFSYTVATVIAGLQAAANMAQMLGHVTHSERYHQVADDMKQALVFHLFDEKEQRFLKKIKRKNGQTIERDLTPDASLAMIWKLNVLPPDDPRVVSTMTQLQNLLRVKTNIGGLSRYTVDHYQSVTQPTNDVPGNPWIITTLWDAQWQISRAKSLDDLGPARAALEWAKTYASAAGILAEQLNPFTGAPLSVAPLTWSHATYVETVLQYVKKEKELKKMG
ncbi:MAG TPA: glycoside hydrolase family 15 protein [Candidatus Peribacteraceae bacterium]|nr:glycoside hydrolase family 15 protein [Candidatus Peribacteraceae bacterium]